MRIAHVAPLYEAVPPRLYGGTERIVAYLADAQVELGHDVTVFASGDSHTRARLVACRDQALRLENALRLVREQHRVTVKRDAYFVGVCVRGQHRMRVHLRSGHARVARGAHVAQVR